MPTSSIYTCLKVPYIIITYGIKQHPKCSCIYKFLVQLLDLLSTDILWTNYGWNVIKCQKHIKMGLINL